MIKRKSYQRYKQIGEVTRLHQSSQQIGIGDKDISQATYKEKWQQNKIKNVKRKAYKEKEQYKVEEKRKKDIQDKDKESYR